MTVIEFLEKKCGSLSKTEKTLTEKVISRIEDEKIPYGDRFQSILGYYLKDAFGLSDAEIKRFCCDDDGHIIVAWITKDDVLNALGERDETGHLKNTGMIRIIDSPKGPVAAIGNCWFYFSLNPRDQASLMGEKEPRTVQKYLEDTKADNVAEDIWLMLCPLAERNASAAEFMYCYFALKKAVYVHM